VTLSALETYQPETRPEARLCRHAISDFETYDLLLAFYPTSGGCEICGYQCNRGKKIDLQEPASAGVRSILVGGKEAQKPKKDSNAAKAGWIVLTRGECQRLMGPTLGAILDFEDALPEGDSGKVDDADAD